MDTPDKTQIAVYLEPDVAIKLKEFVLKTTGTLRGMSPYCRDAIVEKMKKDGIIDN